MLYAALAIDIEHSPVTSLNDIVSSNYKLQVSKGSSVESYFRSSKNNTAHKQIVDANKLVVEDNMNERKVFKRMVNGSQDTNTLLMGVLQPLQYLPEWRCGGRSVNVDYRKINNGWIYQKQWPFRTLFDYHLLRLKEEGEVDRIKSRYYEEIALVCHNEGIKPYTMTEIMVLYMLFGIGFLLSFMVWVLEIHYWYCKGLRNQSKIKPTQEEGTHDII